MRIAFWIVLSLVAMVIIGGCGGSTTESTVPNIVLFSESVRDGQATATSVVTNEDRAKIGDDAGNHGMRAFVSFDLTLIPADAIIDSATLEIYQANNVDAVAEKPGPPIVPAVAQVTFLGDPYNAVDAATNKGLGPVVVDHVYYGDTLTNAAYDMDAIALNIGTLANTWVIGFKQLDVTAAVQADFATRATKPHTQFRIRHTAVTNDNAAEDSDSWVMGEGQGATLNHRPGLVILYH